MHGGGQAPAETAGGDAGRGVGGGGDVNGAGNGAIGGAAGDAGAAAVSGPTLAPSDLPAARVGEPYSAALTVTGESGQVAWSVLGALPPGLMLDAGAGVSATIKGTPTAAGAYTVGVSAKSVEGTASVSYALRVRTLPWLVYTTEKGAVAVDVSSGAPGTPYALSRALAQNESLFLNAEQPYGTELLFDITSSATQEGWVSSFAGLTPTKGVRVNTPQGQYTFAQGFEWSPDGQHLAWESDTPTYGMREGFVADMSGPAPGAPAKVTGQPPAQGACDSLLWGGSNVFFREYGPTAAPGNQNGNRYSVVDVSTLPAPAPVALTDWDAELGWPAPDGKRFAYWQRIDDTTGKVWLVGVGDAAPKQPQLMHPALEADESGGSYITWLKDAASALVETATPGWKTKLYLTRIAADGTPSPLLLNDGQRYVGQMLLSPDEQRLVFVQSSDPIAPDGTLWLSDLSAKVPAAPVELNGPLVQGGDVKNDAGAVDAAWAPDSRHFAYIADALQVGLREAFIVDVANPGKPKRLNTSLPSATSKVTALSFSPDGTWIALLGDLETVGVQELYVVPLGASGPGLPQKVSDTLAASEQLSNELAWAPDTSFLGFVAYDNQHNSSRGNLVKLSSGSAGPPIPVGSDAKSVARLRFLNAGF